MKSVLVVDDEADVGATVKFVLEEARYEVIVCGNGREALECLEKARPDLVITDITMPRMSGLALVDELRRREHLRDIPVLLMSASAPPEELAASAFMKKPFSFEELLEIVRRLVPAG